MIPAQIKCINVELPMSEMFEIESSYGQALDRFNHFIREAQITLRDANGPKGGVDKVCTIQLRFYPRGLAVLKSSGSSFAEAANIACEKMKQVTARRLSKRKSSQFRKSQNEFEGETAHGN